MTEEPDNQLGVILVEKNVIDKRQLDFALIEQQQTNEKLGAILVRLGYVQSETILKALVAQKKIRIGDLLLELNLISDEQLKEAIATQKENGGRLGAILVEKKFIEDKQLLQVLAAQLEIEYCDLSTAELDRDLVAKIPEIYARRFRAIVIREQGGQLIVGMSDPQNILAVDEIARQLQCPFQVAMVDEALMLSAFDMLYEHSDEIYKFAEQLSEEIGLEGFDLQDISSYLGEEDAPVVKLLITVFEEAVRLKASDIHIEPDEKILRIRLRVDGMLQEQIVPEKHIMSALTQRLKLMGGLNITEKRLPQDGRFSMKVKNHSVEVRLSTMPTKHGESVVMRVLQQTLDQLSLDRLGMPADILKVFRKMIRRPHGMILVTGPTGSGKTTTLYSALHEMNKPETKIITVEDPIEYHFPRISQVQVSTKIDLTFATVLRSALRQDPDVIMVGEIRDVESATIALRAAMTGHLVFATLHTTDARSSAMRLMDMGVPNYLVALALRAVLAQRLIRKICLNCKAAHVLDEREKEWLTAVMDESILEHPFYMGSGCARCAHTGYSGRVGIFELLIINHEMVSALRRSDEISFHEAIEKDPISRPLGREALQFAQSGITSIQEVMRVAEYLEDV